VPSIRVHHTATSDARWDGPANESRLLSDGDAAYYRSAFAWQEEGASKKGDYKFPHHEVAEDGSVGAANIRACIAGIAILNGGRGGTAIPDSDREGVYRHLAAHIKDSGATPPELKTTMNQETKHLDVHLNIKAFDAEAGTFHGDLSVYDFVDYGGDVTVKGCFTKTLQENGGKVPMLYQHDMARPIGHMELVDGETALECKGVLNMALPDAQVALATMKHNQKHGIKTGLSMGYFAIKDKVDNGIRYLTEVKLLEGSVVTLAANQMCAVTDIKKLGAVATLERKDFASELEDIQVRDLFYQLISALWSALSECMYSSADTATAASAVKQEISAFQSEFLNYVSRSFNEASDSEDQMEMAAFPTTAVAQKFLADMQNRITALLGKSRATDTAGAASDDGAATQLDEPGSHSFTPEQIGQAIKSLFRRE